METKICTGCLTVRTVDQFYPAPANPDGRASRCIRCALIASREPTGDYVGGSNRAQEQRRSAKQPHVELNAKLRAAGVVRRSR
jgi:hypothetical protein